MSLATAISQLHSQSNKIESQLELILSYLPKLKTDFSNNDEFIIDVFKNTTLNGTKQYWIHHFNSIPPRLLGGLFEWFFKKRQKESIIHETIVAYYFFKQGYINVPQVLLYAFNESDVELMKKLNVYGNIDYAYWLLESCKHRKKELVDYFMDYVPKKKILSILMNVDKTTLDWENKTCIVEDDFNRYTHI